MLHPEWLDETWVTCGWRLSVRCSFVKSAGSYRWSRKSIITIWGRYTAKWIQIIYVTLYSLPVPSLLRKPLGLENAAWKFEFCSFFKFIQKSAKYHKIAANIRFKKPHISEDKHQWRNNPYAKTLRYLAMGFG